MHEGLRGGWRGGEGGVRLGGGGTLFNSREIKAHLFLCPGPKQPQEIAAFLDREQILLTYRPSLLPSK